MMHAYVEWEDRYVGAKFIILAGSRIKLWEIGHKPVPLRDFMSPVARLVREQGAIGEIAESE